MKNKSKPKSVPMRKIAINVQFGGFTLSPKVMDRLYELGYRKNVKLSEEYYKMWPEHWVRDLKEFNDYKNGLSEYTGTFHFYEDGKYVSEYMAWQDELPRDTPELIQALEELLGNDKELMYIKIVEVPMDVEWEIDSYDGAESVVEKKRKWN